MFDIRDAFYWNGTTDVQGTGLWNRDAYINESVTFDNAGAHQAGNNHHYHANPRALRHLLGDHVGYNEATNVYTEDANTLHHSPILAWVKDGYPIYGPYGYSDPMNPASGVRRMTPGYARRTGLATSLRDTLPAWAARAYNRSATLSPSEYGPNVSASYPLGRYLEDNDYLGDLGFTQGTNFDLNEYNVRFCVTPEFPAGIWAYFLCIAADGTPVFPYQVGRSYFGDPTGGAVTSIAEPVATALIGGPFKSDSPHSTTWASATGDVTFVWNGVEGGIYRVEASEHLTAWGTIVPSVTATGSDFAGIVEGAVVPSFPKRFYRTVRTGLSTYDRTGFAGTVFSSSTPVGGGPNTVTPNTGAAGAVVGVVIELSTTGTPALPNANVGIFAVTAGTGIALSGVSRPSQTLVVATFTISAGAVSGARNVAVQFNAMGGGGGPTRTLTNAFAVQ